MSAATWQDDFPTQSFVTAALAAAGSPAHLPAAMVPQVPLGVPIEVAIRDEAWGDQHFVILDPAGIAVDVVQHG